MINKYRKLITDINIFRNKSFGQKHAIPTIIQVNTKINGAYYF